MYAYSVGQFVRRRGAAVAVLVSIYLALWMAWSIVPRYEAVPLPGTAAMFVRLNRISGESCLVLSGFVLSPDELKKRETEFSLPFCKQSK